MKINTFENEVEVDVVLQFLKDLHHQKSQSQSQLSKQISALSDDILFFKKKLNLSPDLNINNNNKNINNNNINNINNNVNNCNNICKINLPNFDTSLINNNNNNNNNNNEINNSKKKLGKRRRELTNSKEEQINVTKLKINEYFEHLSATYFDARFNNQSSAISSLSDTISTVFFLFLFLF